jgi:hypothetical protein
MPFHICADEVIAFMMMFPFIGIFFRTNRDRIHLWFHRMRGTKPVALKRECPHDHEEPK